MRGKDKYCSKCLTIKFDVEFSFDKTSKDGRAYWCKKCAATNSRINAHKRLEENPEDYKAKKRKDYIKSTWDLTIEEYEAKLLAQQSKCKICEIPLESSGHHTHLDHNHATGSLRDFLCTNCNRGLGHFQDTKELLMKAAAYLESHTDDGNQKEGRRL